MRLLCMKIRRQLIRAGTAAVESSLISGRDAGSVRPGSVVELASVGYRYPTGLQAIDNVSLTIGQAEIVALVGPSGCGKSTLLNLITGLREPTSGEIRVEGQDATPRLGRFSYMPQRDLLLPWRTALDNAGLLLEVRGARRGEARARAMAMLEQFELAEFARSLPGDLSGGMRQRVALIRTFLPGRDVLLDEPFGALDAITRADLQEWLLGLHAATGPSIFLVTHDIEEAVFLADRVYLMSPRPGRMISERPIDLPRPRTATITTTAEFSDIKADLRQQLRAAMQSTRAETWAA